MGLAIAEKRMPPTRKIDALLPLQELDLAIHRLRVRRDELPRKLAGVEEKVARAKTSLDAVAAEIKALKLEAAKRESSVKEFDDRILKLTVQANQARKNDEYQVFLKEISGAKAEKSRIEDGQLDLLYQVDEKAKLEKLRVEDLKSAEQEHAVEKRKIEAEIAELDGQIAAAEGNRPGLTGGVDREILAAYDRILAAKDDGLAIAPVGKYDVIEDEGKATYWQCEGCNVGITSQDLNVLLLGKDVLCCRNCSRILYAKAPEKK
ncbi:MAG: hypothetical protein HYY17_17205 [Planctomycetes bacterium]|nr:hypothetical protein [Planctomycetota bacterium]